MNTEPEDSAHGSSVTDVVHYWVITALQLIMLAGLLFAAYRRHWFDVLTIMGIVAVMRVPHAFGRRYHLKIPPEFELMAVIFVFASLFLGELHGYYIRFWWWDVALHTSSGFLLGILGFLMVYVLNEDSRVSLSMRPRFVALFALVFAVSIGVLWEIFEFSMDRLVGTTMQKPMLGDSSGLTDTMFDMVVNCIGALSVALFGWWHMRMRKHSVFDNLIAKFVSHNQHLFTSTKIDR